MLIKRIVVLFTFLLASLTSLYSQTRKFDSLSTNRTGNNTLRVSNSKWEENIIPDVRIKWVFQNDSTFFRTAIWPDGPENDVGKYKIDKKNNIFSIQWRFRFSIGSKKETGYSDPQLYSIIKMTENEIILRKQVSKEDKTDGLSAKKNYICLVKVQ